MLAPGGAGAQGRDVRVPGAHEALLGRFLAGKSSLWEMDHRIVCSCFSLQDRDELASTTARTHDRTLVRGLIRRVQAWAAVSFGPPGG